MQKAGKHLRETVDFRDSSDDGIFDLAFLNHQTLGRDSLRTEILKLFRDQLHVHEERLLTLSDAGELKMCVHTIKGAAGGVGAQKLAAIAIRLDGVVSTGEPVPPEEIERMVAVIRETLFAIDAMTAGLAPGSACDE